MQSDIPVIGRRDASLSRGPPGGRSARCARNLRRAVLGTSLVCGVAAAQVLPPPAMSPAEQALLDAVNVFRVSQGWGVWAADPGLAAVARGHSQSMAAQGRFSHDGFQSRARSTGSALCVENLLLGHVPPTEAVQRWLRSGSHHDNLLEPAAHFAGVGIAGRYVTLLACATALSDPPAPARAPP
jgi:uncharacterized protein YkwD